MINRHNEDVRMLEMKYTRLIEEEIALKSRSQEEKQVAEAQHRETIKQIEEETKREVDNLKQKFEL